MKLVVGLGNPGKEYANTRHNVGFSVVDEICRNKQLAFKKSKKLFSEIAMNKPAYIIAKPQTFMNNSGQAAQALLEYFNIEQSDLIVAHDDKDLPLGTIKIQTDRSSAGHNGVQSIINRIGTQNFTRVRIGIAPTDPKFIGDTNDFVLAKFTKEEKSELKKIIAETVDKLEKMLKIEK